MSNTNPSASASRSPSPRQQQQQQDQQQDRQRLKVHTHHCRFCNHLLLATTRTIATLPRRKPPAQDNALILPLPRADDDDDEEELDADAASPEPAPEPETNAPQNPTSEGETEGQGQGKRGKRKQKHTTILLSTTLPDRKASLIRREDGFEKRRFVRCGRCRVVVGYFLDAVHFPVTALRAEDGMEQEQEPRVVYLLPGALMETEDMGDEEKMRVMDREWSGWISQ